MGIVSLIILMFFSWKKGVHHTLYDKPLEPEDAVKQYAASISVQPAAAAIPAATQQAFK